jgi:chromosome segregation ATPase
MLEDLRENVLALLEERVERAIDTIHRLREEKGALESRTNELHAELKQRDARVQELEKQNAELRHFESELKVLQEERVQERHEIDEEKAEIRDRLEGLMAMLNSVDHKTENQLSEETVAPEDADETEDLSEADPSTLPPPSDDPSEETESTP